VQRFGTGDCYIPAGGKIVKQQIVVAIFLRLLRPCDHDAVVLSSSSFVRNVISLAGDSLSIVI
jgi:uroporphyrinogen-III synthase